MAYYFWQDSPTNKLLFARDIPRYRKWVERYYKEVAEAPPVSDHEMNVAMTEISMVSFSGGDVIFVKVPSIFMCFTKIIEHYAMLC